MNAKPTFNGHNTICGVHECIQEYLKDVERATHNGVNVVQVRDDVDSLLFDIRQALEVATKMGQKMEDAIHERNDEIYLLERNIEDLKYDLKYQRGEV